MAGMSDEEWKASNLRKEQFKEMAKNPPEEMTVYRIQGGDPTGSLGLHWSTDPNVAHHTGLGGAGERTVHRAIVSRRDIISQGEWVHGDMPVRGYEGTDEAGAPTHIHHPQWGLDMEAEVRLRPGATVREHATAPAGVHEYTPTGREPTIEARGNWEHINLAHHAVQGTEEAERLHNLQHALPHVQQTMFDEVQHRESGEVLGYTPKLDINAQGDWHQHMDDYVESVRQIEKSHGLGEFEATGMNMREPPLSELRQPPKHVNQEQFKPRMAEGITPPFANPGSISVRSNEGKWD
jgi:hypothetical protein